MDLHHCLDSLILASGHSDLEAKECCRSVGSGHSIASLTYLSRLDTGVSLEFLSLNLLGFIAYSIFSIAFLLSSKIQQQYRNTHNGNENLVRWNDAAFALHAFFMAAWQFGCMFFFKRAPGQHVAIWAKALSGVGVSTILAALTACIIGGGDDDSIIRWLDFVNICSYVKLVITLVKYTVSLSSPIKLLASLKVYLVYIATDHSQLQEKIDKRLCYYGHHFGFYRWCIVFDATFHRCSNHQP
jgi:hypothetical protein